jgi:hypothetical protein
MKVQCNAIGSVPHLCKGCGAASPHDHHYCEPCPANKEAQCIVIDESPEQFGKKPLSEIAFSLTT